MADPAPWGTPYGYAAPEEEEEDAEEDVDNDRQAGRTLQPAAAGPPPAACLRCLCRCCCRHPAKPACSNICGCRPDDEDFDVDEELEEDGGAGARCWPACLPLPPAGLFLPRPRSCC
jgi:hypothetical protein